MPSSRKSTGGTARVKKGRPGSERPEPEAPRHPRARCLWAGNARRCRAPPEDCRGGAGRTVQSNCQGELIDRIQATKKQQIAFIIVNPGGFTHSGVALRDALAAVAIPFIEAHLSNIHAREPVRRDSYFLRRCARTICGLGSRGYNFALSC